MTPSIILMQRELRAAFRSPLGAVVIAGVLLADGILFYWSALSEKLLSAEVLEKFFYNASGITMISAIALSMRLIAEERQTGTLVLLNTSPISSLQVVIGKYLSAFVILAMATLLSLYMPMLIFVNGKVSVGHIFVGALGLLLLGSATMAIGLFASALAKSQVVSALIGAAITGAMTLLWIVGKSVEPPLKDLIGGLALHHENFRPFLSGTLSLGCVMYYVAVTYFFLLLATKTLEARRWR
jgi:ABC-2 type transport system permease protein